SVWLDGRPVVVGPGTGVYLGRPAWRDRFRGVAAHATVCIDGEEPSPIPASRPFALPDRARARLVACEDVGGRWRCAGTHEGYARLGVTCRREVRFDRGAGRVDVIDTIQGAGAHRVELSFPLAGAARRVDGGVAVGAARLESGAADGDKPVGWRLDPGAVSPRYGEIAPAPVARRTGRVQCPVTLVTSIVR